MHIVRRLLIVRWALYGVVLSGVGIWSASTEPGQFAIKQARDLARGYARVVPEATARNISENPLLMDLADEADTARRIALDSTNVFVDQSSALAFASVAALPDPDELAAALEGWQTDLIEAEARIRESLPDDATQEDIERELRELFRPRTVAAPIVLAPSAEPAPPVSEPETPDAETPTPVAPDAPPAVEAAATPPTRTVAFAPHPAFYKCPVIEVSNAGRVDGELTLLDYTPWVDTPAGVLIRAPVAGACLSSGYGTRNVDGTSKNHAGVDYYNREGADIFAAGDGVVTQAGEDGAYGYSVRIDHGGGVESHYAHMVAGSLKVRQGDTVRLGQPIGVMGRSGRAYAVHLHYELRFAGETVDPMYEGKRAAY